MRDSVSAHRTTVAASGSVGYICRTSTSRHAAHFPGSPMLTNKPIIDLRIYTITVRKMPQFLDAFNRLGQIGRAHV